jgi:hypothetical protein
MMLLRRPLRFTSWTLLGMNANTTFEQRARPNNSPDTPHMVTLSWYGLLQPFRDKSRGLCVYPLVCLSET